MYETHFGLKCKPFSLLPDPEFLFLSSRHAIGLSLLEYSLTGQAGFCVITGEIGSGKTTLVRAFLGRVGRDFTVGLISNTHHSLKDIAAWAMAAFGQKASGTHPADTYQELMAYLISEYGSGRQCILIVDEAQNLSIEVLEELRLLSNINSGKDLLLQVVLVGQPELLEKLRRPELSQFAQRIAVSHHLTPLLYAETRRYIEHRVKTAGSARPLFTEMAMGAVQYFSGGIPRLINSICDMALVYGFADEQQTIGDELVFRVVSDRQMSGIAPFAQSVPVDDPSVRAEITRLANFGISEGQPAAPAVGVRARAEAFERGPEPALTIPENETVEVAADRQTAPQMVEPGRASSARASALRAAVPMPEAVPAAAPQPISVTPRELAIAPAHEPFLAAPAQAAPMRAREVEAPVVDAGRANPYFFRDQLDDEEELLLAVEMNDADAALIDSSVNTHRLMPASQSEPLTASSYGSNEPYLGPTRNSDINSANVESTPNLPRATEESPASVVDQMARPTVNERRLGTPIPPNEHGTRVPPRRSWWRRSIGRSS